mmetsp:Transcript_56077/g.159224  ORF Transcript_56077/g.159224 Transcript_56077/m.159224 type:complete len:447 (-) Transcript_56077:142-1482(-)
MAVTKFSRARMAVYTAGNMIGTGTHQTLIGLAQGGCGNLIWSNFLLAGMLVTLSAWPLRHLYSKFPTNECLHQAAISGVGVSLGSLVSFINGQLITIELLFAVTMQVSFFGKCVAAFLPEDAAGSTAKALSLGLLGALWLMYRRSGALFTANLAYKLGVAELLTVGLIIMSAPLGYLASVELRPIESLGDWSRTDLIKFPLGIHMAVFAYGGFPGMVQSGDLVEDAPRNLPLGIIWACFMTTWVYVFMSASVLIVADPAAIANFSTAFDSLRGILPVSVIAVISCTVLSSVANNILENALVIISNLQQMSTASTDGHKLALPNLGLCGADVVTFGAVAALTTFKNEIGLGVLGDAIDFALILQFAIFAVLSMANLEDSRWLVRCSGVSMLSLGANSVLGVWHFRSTSPTPMAILTMLVLVPLLVSLYQRSGGRPGSSRLIGSKVSE